MFCVCENCLRTKMYKRYLEPDGNVPLTTYMTKRIKMSRSKFGISNQKSVSTNEDDLIQDNNVETIAQNDQALASQLPSIEREDGQLCNDDDDFFNLISDQLIHPNLLCKIADGIAMILAYFLKHHLSWVALEDLLKLFHNVLGEESNLPKTKYFFKKCFGTDQRAVFHFYCKKCMVYIDTYENLKSIQDEKVKNDDRTCDTCSICTSEYSLKKMNDGHFFIQLPLREQIEKKISENVEILDYYKTRNSNSADIKDIFDCELYQSLRAKVGDGPLITLTLNTDGVRVFKSKRKASLWPIQMFMNEVPPNKRFKQANIILNGIWFGKDPHFELYLKPLNTELKCLDDKKINVITNNVKKDVTVRVLLVSSDLPAKAKIMKMKQFNGEFGCSYCLHPGFMVGDSTTSKYTVSSSEKYSLRTHSSTVALMKLNLSSGKDILGVMGVSPLIGFRDFDLILGTVIDYLHCILEGITKLKLHLWFDSKHNREKYYITPRGTEVVNKNIKTITPFKTFSIKPRMIEDREYWKAHELKYWLLFYGTPCLQGTLKPIYWNHFNLLSEAIFIFLKSTITPSDFQRASSNLIKYEKEFQSLYGEENMVHNVHLVQHLSKCVEHCGPLWAYSNFPFESNNGCLVKHVNGTTDVEHQISSKYYFNNTLATLRGKNESTFNFMERMNSMRLKKSEKIGEITVFGSPHKHQLDSNQKIILKKDADYIKAYYKFFHGNDVYFSSSYKRAEQTNDTVVLLKDKRIGQIRLIFQEEGRVFILLKMLKTELVPQFSKHINKICNHITDEQEDEFVKVFAEEVLKKLLLISTVNKHYLSELPNDFEGD